MSEKTYTSYDHDRLEAADKLRIERSIYFESGKADISDLTALSLAQLMQLRQESAAAEQGIFESLKAQAAAWEEQAGKTLLLDKAIAYVRTPEVKHTANRWQDGENDRHTISNRVYRMDYHSYENTRYDREKQQSVPYSYTLTWSVRTNSPDTYRQAKIAGQDRKVFADRAAMEKYLKGRIKAYQHLFTELSPPIPKEYAEHFKVNGQLLPGYTIEGEERTPTEQAKAAEKADLDAAATEKTITPTAEPPQPRPVIPIVLTSEKPADKLQEITDRLEQGIKELFESERYKEYLRVMSKFHHYSFNNTVLIAMQKPDASLVAGFSAWKNNFHRNVIKGEKGIRILAPAPFKIKREMEKLDPQTQQPIIGKDGKPVTEEQEVTIPAFKVVSVFDVSQTEGREIPSIAVNELTGDVEQYKDFFAALEKTSPVPIGFEQIEGSAHGYYHLEEKRIALDEGMSELQTLKTAIHEIAHAKLHDIDRNAPKEEWENRPDRHTREVQAESVAYVVCQHYGLDTSDYSFGYVAGWSSGKELTELKGSLETIRSAANEIISSIDGHLKEIQKTQEKEATEQTSPDKDTFSIYQLKRGDETRDLRFAPFDRLTAAGHSVDQANYDLIYTAPLTPDMMLGRIWEVLNTNHPKDFKGHSLSVSDVVVLHQNGQDTAHYVDSYGYTEIPQFLQEQPKQQEKAVTPDALETGETIRTPRGTFYITAMSREQMEAAGYGMHHSSEDGKYLIMGNGTQAYAVAAMQPENYLKSAELSTEQNDNMIDGILNNTPTADELEQKMRSGEPVSLSAYAAALKNEKQKKPEREEKPSIRAQLQAYKEQNAKEKRTKSRTQDLERG